MKFCKKLLRNCRPFYLHVFVIFCFVLLSVSLSGCEFKEVSSESQIETESSNLTIDADKAQISIPSNLLSLSETEEQMDRIFHDCLNILNECTANLKQYDNISTEEDLKEIQRGFFISTSLLDYTLETLNTFQPSDEYRESWNELSKSIPLLIDCMKPFTNLDPDHDGSSTSEERVKIYDTNVPNYKLYTQKVTDALEVYENRHKPSGTVKSSQSDTYPIAKCIECGKNANYTYTNPFSGDVEDYCYDHYNEIVGIMSRFENDVEKSNQSKHICEECSREGTHEYQSFTGITEYYCTEHYEELKEMLKSFGLD